MIAIDITMTAQNNKHNVDSLKDDLRRSIAGSLGVDKGNIELTLDTKSFKEKGKENVQFVIRGAIEITDKMYGEAVLKTVDGTSPFSMELTRAIKKKTIFAGIVITELRNSLIKKRKKLYFIFIVVLSDLIR